MEKIYEFDMLNAVPLREAMELLSISHQLNCGWVCCQKQGNMYGVTLIKHFRDNIDEMFKCVDHYNGENMTAQIMEVECYRRYPDDYALP